MSSLYAVSALPLPNTNNNNNNNNSENHLNHTNESQEIINNLKLIKEKMEVNGVREREPNKWSNNGFNGNQSCNTSNGSNGCNSSNGNNGLKKKCLQIDTMSENYVIEDNHYDDDYSSGPSTLSSSPITSPNDESFSAINEALLEQKFSKLGLDLKELSRRTDSPTIQINGNNNSFDDEEEDELPIRAPLLRSTSLKTGKTPPGTPHRKKIVRFADALGLDLESVRHILTDDLPTVPQSAFGALNLNERRESEGNDSSKQIPWFMQKPVKSGAVVGPPRPNLVLEFIQPVSLLNFIDRVRNNKVCLENCVVSNSAGNLSLMCVIRVLNVSFEKSVTLRYTLNEWLTFNEALASHIPNSCDGFSDKFTVTFSISAGGYSLSPGQRLLFALKFTANSEEYWDNNMGLNYSLIYRV